ncbi:hypothetical protein BZL30_5718 [Mycobacterium kansasii]|uniref:Uncharacterized protein n=1 Tax=Mycobacterium kansasii TaxID=1768 RepID=A0A1V3WYE1_MYCKA|nr:hypothetical protein BZL30_5718 [Mycobacterium kansasii]
MVHRIPAALSATAGSVNDGAMIAARAGARLGNNAKPSAAPARAALLRKFARAVRLPPVVTSAPRPRSDSGPDPSAGPPKRRQATAAGGVADIDREIQHVGATA